jgi:hypothetical protein
MTKSFPNYLKYIESWCVGSVALCFFSTFQKMSLNVPLKVESYITPFFFGGFAGLLVCFWFCQSIKSRKELEQLNIELENKVEQRTLELKNRNQDLENALAEIKTLKGFIPICANCHKIRDDDGYWQSVEKYIEDRSEAQFSHSICQECARKLYPELYDEKKSEDSEE